MNLSRKTDLSGANGDKFGDLEHDRQNLCCSHVCI